MQRAPIYTRALENKGACAVLFRIFGTKQPSPSPPFSIVRAEQKGRVCGAGWHFGANQPTPIRPF